MNEERLPTLLIPACSPQSAPRPSPKRKRADSVSYHAEDGTLLFAPAIDIRLRPLPDHLQRSVSPYPHLLDQRQADTDGASPVNGAVLVRSRFETPPPPQQPAVPASAPGARSPRTVVATQFGHLSLTPIPVRFGKGESGNATKKPKLEGKSETPPAAQRSSEGQNGTVVDDVVWHDAQRLDRVKAGLEEGAREQLQQKGHHDQDRRHDYQQVTVEIVVPSIEQRGLVGDNTNPCSQSKTKPHLQHPSSLTKSKIPSKSPPPPPHSPPDIHLPPSNTVDPGSLTWHDSEITGHLALDPDDDGTGINGVGFRPTPAMQYARQQARRRQVADWKRREAGEERRRRLDMRRRSGYLGTGEVKSVTEPSSPAAEHPGGKNEVQQVVARGKAVRFA